VYSGGGGGGGDGGCDAGREKVVSVWCWWRKHDGKRFGRRWIRAESISNFVLFCFWWI
jgi:hypothetical protein